MGLTKVTEASDTGIPNHVRHGNLVQYGQKPKKNYLHKLSYLAENSGKYFDKKGEISRLGTREGQAAHMAGEREVSPFCI